MSPKSYPMNNDGVSEKEILQTFMMEKITRFMTSTIEKYNFPPFCINFVIFEFKDYV